MKINQEADGKHYVLNGHTWSVNFLGDPDGDGSVSVRCMDEPDIDVDGIDYTSWPTDEQVSGWVGIPVRFHDAGDDPDHPEGIFRVIDQ